MFAEICSAFDQQLYARSNKERMNERNATRSRQSVPHNAQCWRRLPRDKQCKEPQMNGKNKQRTHVSTGLLGQGGREITSVPKQDLTHVDSFAVYSDRECIRGASVDVRIAAVFEKQCCKVYEPFLSSEYQRRGSCVVCCVRIGLGLKQKFHDIYKILSDKPIPIRGDICKLKTRLKVFFGNRLNKIR